ncbi:MAG: SDR family NAD(P)-dependent oxidoreductase [Myxococcota bacterium]
MNTESLVPNQRPVAWIVGASSGMGEQLAKSLVRAKYRVVLIARREDKLQALAKQLNEGYSRPIAYAYAHDVTDFSGVPLLFAEILTQVKSLDLLVYMAGVMPEVQEDEFNFEKDQRTVQVNLMGALAWLNCAAERCLRTKHGHLVAVGSVAGDRGRRKSPAYAASKAALDTYMESLRNRLSQHGIDVTTIKPGPVRTPMTEGLGKLPLLIDAQDAASQIVQAIKGRKATAYVPKIWRPIMWGIKMIPSRIFRRLSI